MPNKRGNRPGKHGRGQRVTNPKKGLQQANDPRRKKAEEGEEGGAARASDEKEIFNNLKE